MQESSTSILQHITKTFNEFEVWAQSPNLMNLDIVILEYKHDVFFYMVV